MSSKTEPARRPDQRKSQEGFPPIRAPVVAAAAQAAARPRERETLRREPPSILRDAPFES